MILVVGNINYDILLPLDRLPGPHEKMTCSHAVTGFGGSAANTAYWLAKLGRRVSLAGAVGTDTLGGAHLDELARAGVHTEGVIRVDAATGVAVIFSLGREKRMVRVPGANMRGQVHPALVEGCRLVYLSGGDTPTLAGYAARANSRGIPVYCGWHGACEKEIAGFADGFILNSDELRQITGIEDSGEAIGALDAAVAAVTLPSGGCIVSEGIRVLTVTAPELEPVDRTGGGDAFAAGFLAGIHAGMGAAQSAGVGNRLAAAVIMEMGARPDVSIGNLGLGIQGPE